MSNSIMFRLPRFIKASFTGTTVVLACSLASNAFAFEHSSSIEHSITNATCQHNTPELKALADSSTGYNKAYALYRLAQVNITNEDKSTVITHLNDAIALLAPIRDPEADVLKAAIWGLLMGADPKSASTLYPQVQQTLAAAKAHKNAKPRALLIEGINAFYVPPAYGGGTEKARLLFKEALSYYQSPAKNAQISWGEVETNIWLGQVLEQEGQKEEARSAYEEALTLDPNCTWAKLQLSQLNEKP